MDRYKIYLTFLVIISTLVYGSRGQNQCEKEELPCDDGQCIHRNYWCDRFDDCPDKSDQKYCAQDSTNNCTSIHFRCGRGMCVPISVRCDGVDDCKDNTDEQYCERDVRSHIPPKEPDVTQRPPTKVDYPYVERESPLIFPPRSILYPPQRKSQSSSRRITRPPNFSHFYFAENYTEKFNYNYRNKIKDAKAWLLSKRNDSYNWDRDTPRALIALSLISNSFKSDEQDNELMRKGFQTYLGIKLLRNNTGIEKIGLNRLAMYINALLATCQDPRDFLGLNLVESLQHAQYQFQLQRKFINPFVFLSLCLADAHFNETYLQRYLVDSFPSEISKDLHIHATSAMACLVQRNPYNNHFTYLLDIAARNLLSQINRNDGSFGSKYSTALAAQALMSINSSYQSFNPRKTLDYLADQQLDNGSFGDMLSTYHTLIALSGRSLLHLRNTQCGPFDDEKEWSPEDILNREGARKSILYTLRYGFPETFSAGVRLSVPIDTNFYDIMRVAAHQDPRFKFSYKITNGQMGVHTIANVPNDPERGMFWTLYWLPSSMALIDLRDRYTGGMQSLIPQDGDELLFWYLSDMEL